MRHPAFHLAVAAFALLPGALARAGEAPDAATLVRELASAVDLPTPKARALAADALAMRAGVTLDGWRDAMKAFAPSWTGRTAGHVTETAPLPVLDTVEATSIAVFVPKSVQQKTGPTGLLLAYHGQGGNGGQMTAPWLSYAEASGLVIVAPTETGKNDGYLFSTRERAAGMAALRWARRRFDVDENRVYLTGWSRGGHMAWDVALHNPDRFAALVPVVGAPRLANQQAENNVRYLENLIDLPIRDLQGSGDAPMLLRNLHLVFERLKAWKARDAKLIEFPNSQHDADLSAVDWAAFFAASTRDPRPQRIVRRAASLGPQRSAFAEILAYDKTVAELVTPIQPKDWDTMTADGKRAFVEGEIEKKTARLEVARAAPNRFEAKSAGVARWRLLLDAELVDASKPVVVVWNGRTITRGVAHAKAVLLRDFVERFDRTYLPTVEITVP